MTNYRHNDHVNGYDDEAQAPPKKAMSLRNQRILALNDRVPTDYITGLTMPDGIPLNGNINAWNDYCMTLAYMQLTASVDNYDTKYKKCIEYFKSTYQKMCIFRLLYLQHSVSGEYTKSFIYKRLNFTRGFVYGVIKDAVEEGWVTDDENGVNLTQHGIEAFRHYAVKWWKANENSGLSGQYFRVWHSRNADFVKDNICNQYLQKYL
tara:strand:+ start:585 stop:1205 length:621 start_codon:yes stop_codon:yes gene_type:complete